MGGLGTPSWKKPDKKKKKRKKKKKKRKKIKKKKKNGNGLKGEGFKFFSNLRKKVRFF